MKILILIATLLIVLIGFGQPLKQEIKVPLKDDIKGDKEICIENITQNKLPNYYSKVAQNIVDSLKKTGVNKILTYYRDTRKEGMELVDINTFETTNHIYTYIIWQDSLRLSLNVIKLKNNSKYSSSQYCSCFKDFFNKYEKLKVDTLIVKKPLQLNYGDSYQFSNITLFNSNKYISFDYINETANTKNVSIRQFCFYSIQFCLLDLENESNWH